MKNEPIVSQQLKILKKTEKDKKILISKTPVETATMLDLEPSITLEWKLRLQIS